MINEHGEVVYLVERIVDKRTVKRGRAKFVEYKVRWLGYDRSEDTWEPASGLKSVAGLINAFEQRISHDESGN